MAALATWLWPADKVILLNDPVALFAFATAVVFWIAVELKFSEEVLLRASSPNDIRLARLLLQYHAEQFRALLKDHDFHYPIKPRYLQELGFFLDECGKRHLGFQDKILARSFDELYHDLDIFYGKSAEYTTSYKFPLGLRISVRSPDKIDDFNISETHAKEIRELNNLGSRAWETLNGLIILTKSRIPEALDEPLRIEWMAPDYDPE